MGNGIYTAVAGSIGQIRNIDVMANNLAHVSTPGFKADVLIFENKLQDAGGGRHTVDNPRTELRLTQGALKRTDNVFDVGIEGSGFLAVDTPNGPRLTRAGRMVVGTDRMLRTAAGHKIYGESGFIRIPAANEVERAGQVAIGKDGSIRIGEMELGTLRLVSAPREALRKAGHDLFTSSIPLDQMAPGNGTFTQGYLERANVNAVSAMTQLIAVQRIYEALQQVVKTYRDVDGQSLRRAR